MVGPLEVPRPPCPPAIKPSEFYLKPCGVFPTGQGQVLTLGGRTAFCGWHSSPAKDAGCLPPEAEFPGYPAFQEAGPGWPPSLLPRTWSPEAPRESAEQGDRAWCLTQGQTWGQTQGLRKGQYHIDCSNCTRYPQRHTPEQNGSRLGGLGVPSGTGGG